MIHEGFSVRRLTRSDLLALRHLNEVFAAAFDDPRSYRPKPSDRYVRTLLAKKHVIVLAALHKRQVVGGLVAYVLEKFERARSEVYLYDLAVAAEFRRQGVARKLIEHLKVEARKAGAWVIFVQADRPDTPAIRLYESLGEREEPLHFDIPVR